MFVRGRFATVIAAVALTKVVAQLHGILPGTLTTAEFATAICPLSVYHAHSNITNYAYRARHVAFNADSYTLKTPLGRHSATRLAVAACV